MGIMLRDILPYVFLAEAGVYGFVVNLPEFDEFK